MLSLISKSYTTISAADIANHMGVTKEGAISGKGFSLEYFIKPFICSSSSLLWYLFSIFSSMKTRILLSQSSSLGLVSCVDPLSIIIMAVCKMPWGICYHGHVWSHRGEQSFIPGLDFCVCIPCISGPYSSSSNLVCDQASHCST